MHALQQRLHISEAPRIVPYMRVLGRQVWEDLSYAPPEVWIDCRLLIKSYIDGLKAACSPLQTALSAFKAWTDAGQPAGPVPLSLTQWQAFQVRAANLCTCQMLYDAHQYI